MEYENILLDTKNRIATITINRSEVLNALNKSTLQELGSCVEHIRTDDSVGAVIITGAGEKAFVAGADIQELARLSPSEAKEYSVSGQKVFFEIENLTKPVIAAINGYALGGGLELAMSCHMRVASEKAKLGQPEVSLGLIPGFCGTQRLSRLSGKGKAMQLILTGKMLGADDALTAGIVNMVVPPPALMNTCREMAESILVHGPLAVRYSIEAINRGMEATLREGAFIEASLFSICASTEDMKEGTKAFLEKRKPAFKGK